MGDRDRFEQLVEIMDRLRGPDGCPWDREQSYESLRSYLIEECYEVAEALDRGDRDGLREELGDLLLQIVFLSRLAKEEGRFTAHDVVRSIVEKMIRRHPHVFGEESAETPDEVLEHWEAIKREEKKNGGAPGSEGSVLAGIPLALPALLKAQRLGTKAARVGFDWGDAEGVLDKIDEELGELKRAVARRDPKASAEELGDLLFSLVNLARHMNIDPEGALERSNLKFRRRFEWIERHLALEGRSFKEVESDRLEELWRRAKEEQRGRVGD